MHTLHGNRIYGHVGNSNEPEFTALPVAEAAAATHVFNRFLVQPLNVEAAAPSRPTSIDRRCQFSHSACHCWFLFFVRFLYSSTTSTIVKRYQANSTILASVSPACTYVL